MVDVLEDYKGELVQLARLATSGSAPDVRLYISRLARRYKRREPELAGELEAALKTSPKRRPDRIDVGEDRSASDVEPSRPSVLRATTALDQSVEAPVLAPDLQRELNRLLRERARAADLERHGLRAASSVIFTGPPGVGKTRTARWIASQLDLPLFSLDLTAVMSSRLGQSGANLRSALDAAKREPSVLFLDELDAIAKRRDDATDIGELKRLVTIMLQELDEWPASSLLVAATNHSDLIDPAIWRRFDMHLQFTLPAREELFAAIDRWTHQDEGLLNYRDVFASIYAGHSFSDVERELLSLRKWRLLEAPVDDDAILHQLERQISGLPRETRVKVASELSGAGSISQRRIAQITGVSRDTIRKHRASSPSDEEN